MFFLLLFLNLDSTEQWCINENMIKLHTGGDSKEYKVEINYDNAFYANKLKSRQLPSIYYLIA